jgi:hypothetical protein
MTDSPQPADINGVPFPGMYWALWDADGKLLSYLKTEQCVHSDWVLHALGYVPPARFTIAEFSADKWADFLAAIVLGGPTDARKWAPSSSAPSATVKP